MSKNPQTISYSAQIVLLTVPSLLLCLLSATMAFAVDYYVASSGIDSAVGGRNQPWHTIGHAAQIVKGGDVVHVALGTYREDLQIMKSGRPGAPIRFISDRKWGAHIVGLPSTGPTGGAGAMAAVDIRAGYIEFIGFAVSAPQGDVGIMITGANGIASYDQIIGNEVYDVAGPCKRGECSPGHVAGGGGIVLSNTTDNLNHNDDVIGNMIHDIGDPNNPQNADLVHGIYIELGGDVQYPTQGTYSAKVQNNVIYRTEGDGISSFHCTSHAIITNNTVVDAGVHGILVSASQVDCRIGARNKPNADTIVANNIVVRSGWHAVCTPQMVQEHLCLRNDFGGGCGIAVTHALHARILSNLSNDNRCHSSSNGILAISDSPAAGHMASANIIGTKPLFRQYNPDGSGDFHLSPDSSAIGKGINLDAPATDFDGNPRPPGAIDLGAYQYIPRR